MFEMHDLNIVCPMCNNPNYMKLMSGANVGKLNVKCTNCNSYFDLNDLEEAMSSTQLEPCNITHADSEHPLSDAEIILRLESIRDSIGGSYAIDRAIELLTKHATCEDVISRQEAIDVLEERLQDSGYSNVALVSELNRSIGYLMHLPSAQPEIIRCKDCVNHVDRNFCRKANHYTGDGEYCASVFGAERRTDD